MCLFRQLLGCCCAISHKGAIEIIVLAVHPEHQGRGYGSKLLESIEKRAKEKVTLGVPSCREDVIPFFLRRGYKVCSKNQVFFGNNTMRLSQAVVSKSVEEMRKLYPDELNEKVDEFFPLEFQLHFPLFQIFRP